MPRITISTGGETTTVTYAAETGFKHPGCMYTKEQLNFVKDKLVANQAPWSTAYNNMVSRTASGGGSNGVRYSSLTWVPRPVPKVGRGAYGNPSQGDADLQNDLRAALCHALIWYYKGTRANAIKSIEILNSWSSVINEILFDTVTWKDGKLIAGWTGTVFARAAEIIRHTFVSQGNEPQLNVENIYNVFTNVWWPIIGYGHNGAGYNTLAVMADSMIQIGVFMDDRAKFDAGCQFWREQLPGMVYLETDDNPYTWGNAATLKYADGTTLTAPKGLPLPPRRSMYDKEGVNPVTFMQNYWHQPKVLVNGMWGEFGRDYHHSAMGHAGMINAAETAWHQGVDLYGDGQERLVATLEFCAKHIYNTFVGGTNPPPDWPYVKNAVGYPTSTQRATYEVAFNHFNGRLGILMPNTKKLLDEYCRPSTYDVELHVCWETLTSYGTP